MLSGLYLSSENYQVYDIDYNSSLWAGFASSGCWRKLQLQTTTQILE